MNGKFGGLGHSIRHRFLDITASLPNEELRDQINDMYARAIPERASQKERNEAASAVINRYPMLMDYYIKLKEEDKEGAKDASNNIVTEVDIYLRCGIIIQVK